MKVKYLISLAIILGLLIYIGLTFRKSLTPYVTFQQAKHTGAEVQVKGVRIEGTDAYDIQTHTLRFIIKDPYGETLPIVYHGVKPSNFEQAQEIVVVGRYKNGVFHANKVLIKCPSKYQPNLP